ncbi:MAG TPA: hypothetical protein PLR99_00420 [Polyangiaceae bacterium]|nr:hypothetical protein [Polyangiaceae bacterium]
MPRLDVSTLSAELRPTGTWAAALLHALARDEAAGRRPARLTEPRLDTWTRFRGRLTAPDLVALLFEDAAVIHPVPFDAEAIHGALGPVRFGALPAPLADAWLAAIPAMDLTSASADYLAEQARLLGVPTRMARSDLHVVKPHQKVLELPGTGGQLAHYLVSTHPGLTLQENVAVACGSWQEHTLAGLVGLDLGAPHSGFATRVSPDDLKRPDHPLRQRSFDFVVGLAPDKGGALRVEDQLALWFPTATVLLV